LSNRYGESSGYRITSGSDDASIPTITSFELKIDGSESHSKSLSMASEAREQQPASLAEELGTMRGGGKVVGGLLAGSPSTMMSGIAEMGLAKYLKHMNSTDTLIQRAFENVTPRGPETGPQQWRPAGLLNSGPILAGAAPDTSFVRGVPAQLAQRQLLLPERAGSPFVTPMPPESLLDRVRRMQGGKKNLLDQVRDFGRR
jgi:hypothetical protein